MTELEAIASARIAELEADLARWRKVLALATAAVAPPVTAIRTPRRIPGEPMVERIIDVVAGHYGVSRDEVLSHSRRPKATTARQVAMRVVREVTGKSYTAIGRAFDRDHSTIIHALAVTEGWMLGDVWESLAEAGIERPTLAA